MSLIIEIVPEQEDKHRKQDKASGRTLEVPIAFQLTDDVDQILRSQAVKARIEPEEYIKYVFGLFLKNILQEPALRVHIAKMGYNTISVGQDLFIQFVRDQADSIALNLQIAQASEPDATPQQRAAAFEAWARHLRRQLPDLPDEALSRESIYGGSE